MADVTPAARRAADTPSVGELVDLVTAYAKQETLGPLRGAGRWLGFGVAAAALLALGLFLVLLGLLRLLQAEWDRSAEGSWSWVPYTIVFLVALGLIGLTISRINKSALNKETP
jgi:Putative Actinobacterial Holin-X, holin superfamily III